ncbi:MAG: hypothetical protein WAK17_03860 [Candidatus Nitrosopolaris sp.]|jgi:hypothetical protein
MSTHGCLLDKTPGQTTTSGQQPQTSGPQAQVLSTGSDNFGVAKVFDDGAASSWYLGDVDPNT